MEKSKAKRIRENFEVLILACRIKRRDMIKYFGMSSLKVY